MDSIWSKTVEMPHFEALEGKAKTDVLIIGGGMAGILCAYFLQKRGVDYILAEANTICSGTTGNTTAKITAQHGLFCNKLLKSAGAEKAKLYLEANLNALKKYFELCQAVESDFEEKTAYVYSRSDRRKLEQEMDALARIGYKARFLESVELPFAVAGAIGFEHQAQFHPLKFLSQIAKDLNIYEHSFVKKLAKNKAVTEKAEISFQKLIVATHFPIENRHGIYFLKMYQHRSYVLALEYARKLKGMYVDEDSYGLSFRNYGKYLLLGGGAHRTGKQGGNWQELREFVRLNYPLAEEKFVWAAQDCMPLDGVPYIGPYSKHMPECFVATGFHKWGITSSMAAAMILADLVMEKENPYAKVFRPSRSIVKPQLFLNGYEAAVGLFTISKKRCPHLGCALKWNSQEKSWDCSCHGSRFDENGLLLDNPANGNLKKGKTGVLP